MQYHLVTLRRFRDCYLAAWTRTERKKHSREEADASTSPALSILKHVQASATNVSPCPIAHLLSA